MSEQILEPSPQAVIEVAATQSGTRGNLACNQCDRTFSRPSHLNRHRLTHLPPSRRNTLPCHHCDQTFSRKDTLMRHLRSTHDIEISSASSLQKSCYRCVRRKLKCDRAQPCHSCIVTKHAESCSYPNSSQQLENGPNSHIDTTMDDSRETVGSLSPQSPNHPSVISINPPGHVPTVLDHYSNIDYSSNPMVLSVDGYSPMLSGDSDTIASSSYPQLDALGHSEFRCNGFDWLDFDLTDADIATLSNIDIDPGLSTADQGTVGLPLSHQLPPIPIPHYKPPTLPWPFEQSREASSPKFHLPSLRDMLHKCLDSSTEARTSAVEGLASLLAEPRLPGPNEVTDLSTSLGLDLLGKLIDSYFASFQTIQAIIHFPTWNMLDCPTIQLASMACIGSVLSTDPNLASIASTLSDFCTHMISWLGLSDAANYSNISYLIALCLHQIYSLGSGDRSLYQNADRTRGVLIGSLRGLGLMKSRPSLQDQHAPNNGAITSRSDAHAEWLVWIEKEKENRLAWASFEYDCSLCTLTSRRGAVDLDELPPRLPCFDSLWEAPSAFSWAALKSRLPQEALGASVSAVLGAAMSGKAPPDHVSTWGKRLCTQAIGRLLWDLKQLETLSTSSFFGLQCLSTGHQQSKASLLSGLDHLLGSMSCPVSTSDLVSYNISSFLCHYSHLYTADNIMDLILYIVRSVVSRGSEHDESIQLARRRLTAALAKDPCRARKLAWHAGQILAVANEYLVSAPCEIMRLFMSYIFLIAFVNYYPSSHHGPRTSPVQLDISNAHMEQKRAIFEWIQMGGPAKVGSADDIFSGEATKVIAYDAQRTFQRLLSWGLADKFGRIILHFESNDVK